MSPERRSAFTLVETALALGIVAFALVPIVGLLPLGLKISRQATDLAISAQIAQRLGGMVQQSDFSTHADPSKDPMRMSYFYFDGDGQPLPSSDGVVPILSVYAASIPVQVSAANPTPVDTLLTGNQILKLNVQVTNDAEHSLHGSPVDLQPKQTTPQYKTARTRTVFVPVYLANNGN